MPLVTIRARLTPDELHALRAAVDAYFVAKLQSGWSEVAEQMHSKVSIALERAGYRFEHEGGDRDERHDAPADSDLR